MIVWLASYPKSGNTWLRSLLSSYFYTKKGDFSFTLLKNIESFPNDKLFENYTDNFENPEDTAKYWIKEQELINKNNKLNFLKTHNALCKINNHNFTNVKNTLGAIYIVRDPRNVVTSIANHFDLEIEEALKFLKEEKKGIFFKKDKRYLAFQPILSWSLHCKSWMDNKFFPTLIIKYEDLQNETFFTFKKTLEFIKKITKSNFSLDRDKIKNSIKNCDFYKLQKMEKEKGFVEAVKMKEEDKKISFFNLGKDNNWKKILKPSISKDIEKTFEIEMKKNFYLD